MELELISNPSADGSTIGSLYKVLFDGKIEICKTLEDEVREVAGQLVSQWKIPGQTAIPSGRYKITINYSPHFAEFLPLLIDVPGFIGIRIHAGNTNADTEGCILVGMNVRKTPASLQSSRMALGILVGKLYEALSFGEQNWITVTRT